MGSLYIVSTPIGNLEDITDRARSVLSQVDFVISEDTRRTKILLEYLGIKKECISYYKPVEAQKLPLILERLKIEDSALVSDAGTPLISDPGFLLVKKCIELGIKVVPVPGPSSVLAALVASGIEPHPFYFYGFLPKGERRRKLLEELKSRKETLIFFESPGRLLDTLRDMKEVLGDRYCCVAREITKIHEEFVRGKISEVLKEFEKRSQVKGEICIVVEGGKGDIEPWEGKALSLLREGFSVKDVSKIISVLFKVPRNEVYRFLQSAK